ncbi:unnamed protein product [Prorocentrum cordatum]|uniref:Uncharacterized protein n=1 Tax=Prorocentrum cordatum TaxID=2364126 RepID=A0ABN9RL18_9DINO|nr:unnamed protein product [Polarella glacialis]
MTAWPGAHLPDSIAVQDLFDAARSVGDPKDAPPKLLLLDDFLGDWMDTLGNAVAVAATDYFMGKGLATLSKKGRANILLTLRYDGFGGWVCGNSVLDGCRSSTGCVQWVTLDRRACLHLDPRQRCQVEGGGRQLRGRRGGPRRGSGQRRRPRGRGAPAAVGRGPLVRAPCLPPGRYAAGGPAGRGPTVPDFPQIVNRDVAGGFWQSSASGGATAPGGRAERGFPPTRAPAAQPPASRSALLVAHPAVFKFFRTKGGGRRSECQR